MITFDPVAMGIKPCLCGRLSIKIHCPFCGSYDCQGRKGTSKRTDLISKTTTEYPIFKCRHCTRMFDDYQWKNECEAPKRITKETSKVDAYKDRMEYALTSGDLSALTTLDKKAIKLIIDTKIKYNRTLTDTEKNIAHQLGIIITESELPSLISNENKIIDEL